MEGLGSPRRRGDNGALRSHFRFDSEIAASSRFFLALLCRATGSEGEDAGGESLRQIGRAVAGTSVTSRPNRELLGYAAFFPLAIPFPSRRRTPALP
jgi:hypothetical protein